jgi:hypothetical protein
MFFNQDRATTVEGRMADPDRAGEAVMTASAALRAGLHIGQVLTLGYYTAAQIASPAFGTSRVRPRVRPRLRLNVRLIGIVVLNRQVVQDDVDRASGFVIFTPALIRAVTAAWPGEGLTTAPGAPVLYGMRLGHGSADVADVERAFARAAPADSNYNFNATSRAVAEVQIAVKPESIAFGVFGAIAGLVALVIGTLAISRQLRWDSEDRQVLRALGAGPAGAVGGGLIGLLAAVVAGSLLAAVTGVVVGVPLGILAGRQLWALFARNVSAVPDATVPALSVLLVGLGALVFANLVAAWPGHTAARSPSALVLRAE